MSKFTGDNNTWIIEVLYSVGGIRATLVSFTPPLLITLNDAIDQVEVLPNQVLPPNSALYAVVRQGPDYVTDFNTRVDGILEVERNATLS